MQGHLPKIWSYLIEQSSVLSEGRLEELQESSKESRVRKQKILLLLTNYQMIVIMKILRNQAHGE